ncbi:MAG: CRISPR-associated endonuclease Cas1 [Acidobacteria bacterium]|nr:CRISPR-associated endonuclease Cas1 [Acidobacteriota bacterium]
METDELKEEARTDSTLAATGAAGDVKVESAGEALDESSAATNDALDAPGTALPGDEAKLFPPPTLFNLRTLYLHEHGATVCCEQERLRVIKDEVEVLSLPLCKVDQIVLFGNSQITTSVMKLCLRKHIPILLLSGGGRFLGSIEAASDHNVELQQKQFERRAEPGFALDVARRMVEGKIRNCRALLQRRGRGAPDERVTRAVEQMQKIRNSLARAATLDEVRGYEGAASAAYYAGLAACFIEPFAFTGRTRRPPCDPINALLSFGYTLLLQNIYALVRGRGLSPYVGLLHELRQGHPALCSDLIEELRAPIVDSLVTAVINKRVFAVTDFYYEDDEPDEAGAEEAAKGGRRGCRMTDVARRKFIAQFEQRMSAAVLHPRARLRTTWRGCIDLQIGHYIRVLRGEAEHYLPLEIR